ncbi:MAG: alpha/beta hydrolase, partial [Pseudomonadota bacterium]
MQADVDPRPERAPFHGVPPGGAHPDAVHWITAADGVRLRAAHWRAEKPRAHVLYLTGRTEYVEKASTPAAALAARGYDVVSVDWRGQGLSDRFATPRLKGHVGDFAEYQLDLDALTGLAADLPGPRLLVAHSMGGAIATAALERADFAEGLTATVLSAPMFGVYMPRIARVAGAAYVRTGLLMGQPEAWPPSRHAKLPYSLRNPAWNLLTQDTEFWDWMVMMATTYPDLPLAMPTIGWMSQAASEMNRLQSVALPDHPVLALIGGEEYVVDTATVTRTCAALGIPLTT